MKESEKIRLLYHSADSPIRFSLGRLQDLQRDCAARHDPSAFYLTVDLSNDFTCPWSHNCVAILGQPIDHLSSIYQLMHPSWKVMHTVYANALLQLANHELIKSAKHYETVFQTNIPLRVRTGQHRWFRQTTFVGMVDETAKIISHFNQYNDLGEFRSFLPGCPVILSPETSVCCQEYNAFFQQRVRERFEGFLAEFFSPSGRRIILIYRQHAKLQQKRWVVPSKGEMAIHLNMKLTTLDRAISRLLNDARKVLPVYGVKNMAGFIAFLNMLVPPR